MSEQAGRWWAAALVACGALVPRGAAASAPIVGGYDAPVDLSVVQVAPVNDQIVCTGVLVAPNLLLTARHCIVDVELDIECDPDKPGGGDTFNVGEVSDPQRVRAFVSETQLQSTLGLAPSAVGRAIFADNTVTLCGHDVAIVQLDRDIAGVPRKQLRLTASSRVGEPAYALGWGVTTIFGVRPERCQRRDVTLLAFGPANYQMVEGMPLIDAVKGEVVVGQSACAGDSGSPLFAAETGAIIGIASYASNAYPDKADPPPDHNPVFDGAFPVCGEGSAAIYQLLSDRPFIAKAFAASGHRPWLEGKPEPTLAFGQACTSDDLCDTGPCVGAPGQTVCAKPCDAGGCPDGYACVDLSGQSICAPAGEAGGTGAPPGATPPVMPVSGAAKNDGCEARGGARPAGAFASTLGLLFLAHLRRRRR
jgi:hypothetical protein